MGLKLNTRKSDMVKAGWTGYAGKHATHMEVMRLQFSMQMNVVLLKDRPQPLLEYHSTLQVQRILNIL